MVARLLTLVSGLIVLAGCGGADVAQRRATLVLDFTPNAVHAGIFGAVRHGDDRAEGVRLTVREPGASADGVKLLLSGRADLAVLDIHDLALARQDGRDLVGVLALVQRPLAAVLAQPAVASPRALTGRRAGVTGLPSDDAVLDSTVRGAGVDPRRVRRVTIGFTAVRSLLARRVDAATAFWNVEGVELRRRRPGIREFRVDAFGAPAYPELVVAVTRRTLERRRHLVRRVTRALARGYDRVVVDPRRGVADLLAAQPGLRRDALSAQMAAVLPAFTSGGRFGGLDHRRLRAWAAWEARFGITRAPPDVAAAFAAP